MLLCLGCVTSAGRAAENTLTPAELAEGWILLFDGETTYGWQAQSEADWKVADGAIAVSSGAKGLLTTTTAFADYVLKVDFRAAQGTNSGIFLRTPAKPTNPAEDCYELNIAPADNPYPTGSLVARQKGETVAESDGWRSFVVTVNGARIQVELDGQQVLDYSDEKPIGRGLIGLQLNQGAVEFRNIKLKPLGLASLFNGKDLSGWDASKPGASTFSVNTEGELHVVNGKGQLETEGRFGDFVFQAECFCNGKELNSGFFFRCIPGDEQMGYESQIHNGTIDGDVNRPNNCGTGGIFRRQDARKVMAKDFEWFSKTIIADGPHMAVWVNGVQVSDWIDTREPHENPRKGLRLEAGTIMIQGHDPTTDLRFRNLRAGEMAGR
ncbi:MAG: DUF1080 domain-containing protein [Planctomycetales bacterium]|nr:DUF1080 domain-containing protein [Planctomycetales bacterium]